MKSGGWFARAWNAAVQKAGAWPGVAILVYTLILLIIPFGGFRWGDGLELAAVSQHLGVAHPPGYPLFTFLGWLFSFLPFLNAYSELLLLQRLLSVALVVPVFLLLRSYARQASLSHPDSIACLSALAFGFSHLVLSNALIVEVYTLNAVFLAWILYLCHGAMQREEISATWALPVAGALFGLAISHHLTALCLAPLGVFALWTDWRRRTDLYTLLLTIPAALIPPLLLYGTMMLRIPGDGGYGIFWGAPDSMAGLWNHLQGGEYRQFQFLQQTPGQGFDPQTYLEFATFRFFQFLSQLGAMFFGLGPSAPLVGFVILILGGYGWSRLYAHPRRRVLAWGILAGVVLQMAFVLTYNIPDIESYFLGIEVLFFPALAAGFLHAMAQLFAWFGFTPRKRGVSVRSLLIFLASAALLLNLHGTEWRRDRLALAWQERLLAEMPEDAALVTFVDADTYTMWYTQFAEKRRNDLFVYGANFLRFPWYRNTFNPDDPRRDLVGFQPGPPTGLQSYVRSLRANIFEPLLSADRVFMTINDPALLQALSQDYQLLPTARLLTDRELAYLRRTGAINYPPPVLYEVIQRERSDRAGPEEKNE